MESTKKELKLKHLLTEIKSDNIDKVSKAIKSLEIHGDSSVILPLSEILLSGINKKNQEEIIEFLSSLKDTSVIVEIMEIIRDIKFISIRPIMLSVVWNTKVDFSHYIDEFVEIATKGSMIEALDCLTIIENLEGPFMEENILECHLHLKDYIKSSSKKEQHKESLLQEIALKIKEITEHIDN
ncbi:MAG: hypothetical protein CL844_07355 [Crocinitomicaceae bacterium]|nr:hypothetical protein [Crocinitomicaceae bacterium]|tara:strand:+ start:45509 stop:46057 length:549 start_codon:yes stop_codon:yes gene_type:complete